MFSMFSMYSVCEVYVVYRVYRCCMWSINGVHALTMRELCLDYVVHVEYAYVQYAQCMLGIRGVC